MKIFIFVVMSAIVICSFGEEQRELLNFPSLTQSKDFSLKLMEKIDAISMEQLFVSFGILTKEEAEKNRSIDSLDSLKESIGEFRYVEEIGTLSLGSYYTKVGYIVKYESGTFFCELKIGMPSKSEYKILGLDITGQYSDNELLKQIPIQYWK